MRDYGIGGRNRVRQQRDHARYERGIVHGVLDAGLVAHVGFVSERQPFVMPMLYAREDESLYLHGARRARIVRLLESGTAVCANVTLLDGIVVARSAFNSSMNYRSAVVFGTARLIDDPQERLRALKVISDHVLPGRWGELRAPTERELAATGVIELRIESASAKLSEGPPEDDEADYALPVWAGVVPVTTRLGRPEPDPRLDTGIAMSAAVAALEAKQL